MASRLKQLEQKYMECMMVAMDKSSRFSVLDSDISTKGFGQMYFMLKASPTKEEKSDQDKGTPGRISIQEKDESAKDLLDVLQNNSRVIITGEPGAGKTTSLVYLTVLLTANYAMRTRISIEKAEPEPVLAILEKFPFSDRYIPVFIKLSEIKEQHLSNINRFNDLIVQQVGQLFSIEDSIDLVEMWQKEERLWVILDGLDEMPGKAREDFLDKLRVFLKVDNDKNRITLSSRPTGTPYESILDKANEGASTKLLRLFSLCPLDGDDASKEFSSAWLQKLGEPEFEKQADKLIEGMYKKGTINLARNPMLLRMMIHVYKTNDCDIDQLPPSRVQLYDKYIHDVVLGKSDLQKFQINNEGNAKRFDQLMHILEHIAWFIHRDDKALQKDDLIEELESYFPEGFAEEDWFNIFSNKMRLLYNNASGEYEFTHRFYQEYFVARRLLAIYKENIRGKQWVLKVISLCAYSDYYREVIMMFLKETSSDMPEEKRYKDVKKLFCKLPMYSVIKTGDLFDERILDPEVALKVEKNNQYKIEAIESLYRVEDMSSVDALTKTLRDKDRIIRAKSAKALGKIGENRAVDSLINAIQDVDSFVCYKAMEALGEIGGECAVEALINALENVDQVNRGFAALALGEIGGERALMALINALREEEQHVRFSVVSALGMIGGDLAVESLIIALRDGDNDVAENAAEALAEIGGERGLEVLLTATQDKNKLVRASSVFALGKISDDRVIDALIMTLQDEAHFVRESAAEALGEIGDDRAIEKLILAMWDEDPYVCERVAEALGVIGGERAVEALIKALTDVRSDIRENAAKALGLIGGDRSEQALIKALQDEVHYVRFSAAEALGEIGDNHAVDALIRALQDENSNVRGSAAEALGEIGDDRAVESLIIALRDDETDVRFSVVSALGMIGGNRVIEVLITALQDGDLDVRKRAAKELKKVGIASHIIKDLENNPKNRKLQKLAKEYLYKKSTLPKLPDPKVPGTDVINFIRKNSKGYFIRLVKAGVVSVFTFSVWLFGKSITKDNLDQVIPGFVKLVDDHPFRTMAILGLVYFVIESWRRFEKNKKSAK